MYWETVDGYPLPKPIGGHPALELCNTRAAWGQQIRPEYEWLRDYDRFAVWARHVGLIGQDESERVRRTARRSPDQAQTALAQAHRLRNALYPTLLEPDGRAFAVVARLAERAAAGMRFTQVADAPAQWRLPAAIGVDLPLLAAARSAADLLSSPDRGLVRSCPGDHCGWLFLDRRGRRKWCSMATCGNRAKVRRFGDRRQTRPQ